MTEFDKKLKQKISDSYYNNYGIENFDEHRFGTYQDSDIGIFQNLKEAVKKNISYKVGERAEELTSKLSPYSERLNLVFEKLNSKDQELWVDLMAFKLLGFKKVKLPRNNKEYFEYLNSVKTLKDANDTKDPHFLHFILEKFNLSPIGYNIQLYFSDAGILVDFLLEQYAYKIDNKPVVTVEARDVVLDIGGCWGDTALYFAHKTGKNGSVYSFEFIPDNIKLHQTNCLLNPSLNERINLVQNPISDTSDVEIYYKDNGPGSRIEMQPFAEQTGVTKTLSIDDFVERNNIERIDFIKMDIEGAEMGALMGAINTIKKFRPKLAIAIYHSIDDMVNIPLWIDNLGLGYDIFIDHFTIHQEETICFAKARLNYI